MSAIASQDRITVDVIKEKRRQLWRTYRRWLHVQADTGPAPIVSNEALEYWGKWYVRNDVARTGLSFLVFMEAPAALSEKLIGVCAWMQTAPRGTYD